MAGKSKGQRKIPRNALEPLMQMCEQLSGECETPAVELFKKFLNLMNRYAEYFFSKPWPKKYDYEEATTFTDEDIEFLFEGEGEFWDRHTTVCLKKNMNLESGFMGYFGFLWTQQAFHEQFVRPSYTPVLDAFETLVQGAEDGRSLLNKLKEQFSASRIHNSLIDLLEYEYPDEAKKRLIEEIFDLLHTEEGLKPCREYRCSWDKKQKYPDSTSHS